MHGNVRSSLEICCRAWLQCRGNFLVKWARGYSCWCEVANYAIGKTGLSTDRRFFVLNFSSGSIGAQIVGLAGRWETRIVALFKFNPHSLLRESSLLQPTLYIITPKHLRIGVIQRRIFLAEHAGWKIYWSLCACLRALRSIIIEGVSTAVKKGKESICAKCQLQELVFVLLQPQPPWFASSPHPEQRSSTWNRFVTSRKCLINARAELSHFRSFQNSRGRIQVSNKRCAVYPNIEKCKN